MQNNFVKNWQNYLKNSRKIAGFDLQNLKFMGRFAVLCLLLLSSVACSGKGKSGAVGFATDGPDLFVVGEYQNMPLEGSIERKALIGIGKIQITSTNNEDKFSCKGKFNSPPQTNLRIRGVLVCEGRQPLGVTMRPLGPDQGLGIAREEANDDLLIFFFHPSKEEATRRFPQIKEQINSARQGK